MSNKHCIHSPKPLKQNKSNPTPTVLHVGVEEEVPTNGIPKSYHAPKTISAHSEIYKQRPYRLLDPDPYQP